MHLNSSDQIYSDSLSRLNSRRGLQICTWTLEQQGDHVHVSMAVQPWGRVLGVPLHLRVVVPGMEAAPAAASSASIIWGLNY